MKVGQDKHHRHRKCSTINVLNGAGPIPEELGSLIKLEALSLFDNSLTGEQDVFWDV